MSLTLVQSSALAELQAREHLYPSSSAFSLNNRRQFARRTLQALVDAGKAEWRWTSLGASNPNGDYVVLRTDEPKPVAPDVVTFETGYMDLVFTDLAGVLERAERHLQGVDFDTLVGTGFSGAAIVPALALRLGKKYILVRKPKDGSHHNGPMVGQLGKRWIFVDDFVSSGETRRRVINAIEAASRPNAWRLTPHETEYVGDYHYARWHETADERGAYYTVERAAKEGWK